MIVRVRPMLAPVFAVLLASSCGGGNDTLTADRSPRPVRSVDAMPSARPTHLPQFASISAALAFIRSKVNVPVVLPSNLPAGTRLPRRAAVYVGRYNGVMGAQLNLRFPHGSLIIEYGDAGFDGCGPFHPRHVHVGRHPAILERVEAHFYELVWPLKKATAHGRYGLSALHVTRDQIMRWARSMDVAVQAARRAQASPTPTAVGC
jgi:hypothetical protein